MSPLQKPIFDEKQPFQPIDIIRVKFAKIANLGVFAGQSKVDKSIFIQKEKLWKSPNRDKLSHFISSAIIQP